MKIAIVGAGAMGGALAAESAAAGHDVHIVDVARALVDHVNAHGLRVEGSTPIHRHPTATTDPDSVGPADIVVLFVKAQHTRSAAATIRSLRNEQTVVVSLQNGWGNTEVLAEELGTDNLVFGVTYNSCSVVDLGVVLHSGHGETFVGDYASGTDSAAAERAAQWLTSSGWQTTATTQVRTEIWKKLILNAATLPTSALTGLTAGALGASESMRSLVDSLADETTRVAQALDLDIDADERRTRIHALLANAGAGKASMLQDAQAQRKTEIEVINEAVVRAGAATGTPTPINSIMASLIKGLEESWQQ